MQDFNLSERITQLMARRKAIIAMRKQRFTVFKRHAVDIDGYSVNYIDSSVKQTTRVAE